MIFIEGNRKHKAIGPDKKLKGTRSSRSPGELTGFDWASPAPWVWVSKMIANEELGVKLKVVRCFKVLT